MNTEVVLGFITILSAATVIIRYIAIYFIGEARENTKNLRDALKDTQDVAKTRGEDLDALKEEMSTFRLAHEAIIAERNRMQAVIEQITKKASEQEVLLTDARKKVTELQQTTIDNQRTMLEMQKLRDEDARRNETHEHRIAELLDTLKAGDTKNNELLRQIADAEKERQSLMDQLAKTRDERDRAIKENMDLAARLQAVEQRLLDLVTEFTALKDQLKVVLERELK